MRRDLNVWLGLIAAMIVGALLPGLFLSIDPPKGHFGWRKMWVMVAPFCAMLMGVLWGVGVYFFRRVQRRREISPQRHRVHRE